MVQKKPNQRQKMRQQAFELVFEKSFGDYNIDAILENAIESRDLILYPYAERVFKGVFEHIEEIDSYIIKLSKGRNFNRLSKVILAALRLAIYEIIYEDDLDAVISINEAVELTKQYLGKDEARFVNGVLGSLVRELNSPELIDTSDALEGID